jgi:DNA-nicking Smr family endonuclease
MSKGRRTRLSAEDRQLWDAVRRTAAPMPAAAKAGTSPRRPPAEAAPPIGGFDRRTASRLSRGMIDVDARIDLHGMTQSAAHRRLLRFLDEARGEGARIALVITGKGAPDAPAGFDEAGRGVLRRAAIRSTSRLQV